jgi:peptide/nickel transport system permease protein
MARYVTRRVVLSIITLWLICTIVFLIVSVLPDDVGRSIAGPFAPQETVDQINERLGTNDPLPTQYLRLLKNTVTFDFGDSFAQSRPVSEVIGDAFWRSAKLVVLALIMTIPFAVAAGVFAARRKDKLSDRSVVTVGLASSSIPDFVSGVVLAYVFGVLLGWFPVRAQAPEGAGVITQIRHLFLPALALVIVYFGYIARITRAGMIKALDADYTRTATMKGLSNRQILHRHVLRNGLQPTVAVVGIQIGYLFGSLVALERIFSYPGIGSTIFTAVSVKDIPVLQAAVILVGIIYMLTTLAADLTIAWMNPRARLDLAEQ